jgi:hypothetical protein
VRGAVAKAANCAAEEKLYISCVAGWSTRDGEAKTFRVKSRVALLGADRTSIILREIHRSFFWQRYITIAKKES